MGFTRERVKEIFKTRVKISVFLTLNILLQTNGRQKDRLLFIELLFVGCPPHVHSEKIFALSNSEKTEKLLLRVSFTHEHEHGTFNYSVMNAFVVGV